jgi:hypothetical protein
MLSAPLLSQSFVPCSSYGCTLLAALLFVALLSVSPAAAYHSLFAYRLLLLFSFTLPLLLLVAALLVAGFTRFARSLRHGWHVVDPK